jgi:hypothetical protein
VERASRRLAGACAGSAGGFTGASILRTVFASSARPPGSTCAASDTVCSTMAHYSAVSTHAGSSLLRPFCSKAQASENNLRSKSSRDSVTAKILPLRRHFRAGAARPAPEMRGRRGRTSRPAEVEPVHAARPRRPARARWSGAPILDAGLAGGRDRQHRQRPRGLWDPRAGIRDLACPRGAPGFGGKAGARLEGGGVRARRDARAADPCRLASQLGAGRRITLVGTHPPQHQGPGRAAARALESGGAAARALGWADARCWGGGNCRPSMRRRRPRMQRCPSAQWANRSIRLGGHERVSTGDRVRHRARTAKLHPGERPERSPGGAGRVTSW